MKRSVLFFLLLPLALVAHAQVTTIPSIIAHDYRGPVTIIFNPNEGNRGMQGATQCYAHTGVTYDGKDWQHCGTWRDGQAKYRMQKDADGLWRLEMPQGYYAYYGVDTAKVITQLCFVFNDGPGGSKEGKTASGGDIFVEIYKETPAPALTRPRPEGTLLGVNFSPDSSSVTLCTFAGRCLNPNDASKLVPASHVFLLGDFNDWSISNRYQLYRDSCYFWITLDSLTPGREVGYQYAVIRDDGVVVRLSDGFAHKQVQGGNLYTSYFTPSAPAYHWSMATDTFRRPDPDNLLICELWLYDYTPSHSFRGLIPRLAYLEQLGVNAIELMPVTESDGDINWGYSPNHYFAPEHTYGSELDLKTLIDSIHAHHMAVILDMVFNHATGLNPQNRLYPYGPDLRYNPWFNANPPHGDNFYEDWNHDFPLTQEMFTRCLNYWLDDYHVDGFRLDLSHGLCGRTDNAMQHLFAYYAATCEPRGAYLILEHWGPHMDADRKRLTERGMLCWHNTNNAYSQLAMGYTSSSSLADAGRDGYVSYTESHDEERNFYKAYRWGAGPVLTDKVIRLSRVPLVFAFNVLLDGPHMFYQNYELGYDYGINMNAQGYEGDYRTAPKPRPDAMGWFTDSLRMAQYVRCAQVAQLRTRLYPELFAGNPVSAKLSSTFLRSVCWGEGDDQLVVVGNFSPYDVLTYDLPEGVWYDYFLGIERMGQVSLRPGELMIVSRMRIPLPYIDITPFASFNTGHTEPDRHTDLDVVEFHPDEDWSVPAAAHARKYLRDGHVVICTSNHLYTLLGTLISH